MKIRVYCELCDREYLLPVGDVWVGLMSCPHDISHHFLKEVIDDDKPDGSNRKSDSNDL